jgi:hypothetical protein
VFRFSPWWTQLLPRCRCPSAHDEPRRVLLNEHGQCAVDKVITFVRKVRMDAEDPTPLAISTSDDGAPGVGQRAVKESL